LRSDHVNDYLRALCNEDFTAKDFRTWHASVCAMELALQARQAHAEAARLAEPAIADIVKQVAQRLGNTSAVCRKFYIHPEVLSYCAREAEARRRIPRKSGLSAAECALLQLLDSCEPVVCKKTASALVPT